MFFKCCRWGEGTAFALGDDGTILGSHFCSDESFVPHDLGVVNGSRPDRHEEYSKHFPKGYEMEFIQKIEQVDLSFCGHVFPIDGWGDEIVLNKEEENEYYGFKEDEL